MALLRGDQRERRALSTTVWLWLVVVLLIALYATILVTR
jgi:hypothetical protein